MIKIILQKIKVFANTHKIVAGVIIIALVLGAYKIATGGNVNTTRYVEAAVQKGTLIVSVSGTGQVETLNQVDIKPKASGEIIYIGVKNSDQVGNGQLIAEIDPKDAKKAVRDAETALDSANLTLQKLTEPADNLALTQTEDALSQAKTNLTQSYDSGYTAISNAFLDLPTIMTGMSNVLYGTQAHGNQDNNSAYADMVKNYDSAVLSFKDAAVNTYQSTLTKYNTNLNDYKLSSRTSATTSIEYLVSETYQTAKDVSDTIKSSNDFLNFVKNKLTDQNQTIPGALIDAQTNLSTYIGKTNADIQSLFEARNSITNSQFALAEKTAALTKTRNGADALDVASQKLNIVQKENALQDAKDNLSNYYITAPFAGIVAKINSKRADYATPGTVVATLITNQKLAGISLNEIDAAKVKVGDKAALTFDAIPDLSISGQVAEIDTIGTMNQGVVTYAVKISFDTQDNRVRPGMSASANIVTNVKQDALLVPSGAIKTLHGSTFVQTLPVSASNQTANAQGVVSKVTPNSLQVQTGLSNDSMTEIISGLKEGDIIIVRTISGGAATTSSAPTIFGSGGNRSGSGTNRTFRVGG